MEIRMIHNGRDRDSLLMPMDDRTVDLMPRVVGPQLITYWDND